MQAFQWRNKTKKRKKKPKHTIFLHLSPFPGIDHIQKRQIRPPQKRLSYWNSKPGTDQSLLETSCEEAFCKVSTLRELVYHLSQQVIQDHPSLIIVLLFLKEGHLYILEYIVMRNVFPKRYCFICNHFWKHRILFNFLKCPSTTNSKNTIIYLYYNSKLDEGFVKWGEFYNSHSNFICFFFQCLEAENYRHYRNRIKI